jgi:hypothetical protein
VFLGIEKEEQKEREKGDLSSRRASAMMLAASALLW